MKNLKFEHALRALAGLAVAAAFLSSPRWNLLWGVNTWGLIGWPWRLGLLVSAMALIAWPVRGWRGPEPAGRRGRGQAAEPEMPARPWRGTIVVLLLVAAALIATWFLLPARTLLLGDSTRILVEGKNVAAVTPRSPFYGILVGTLVRDTGAGSPAERLKPVQLVSSISGLLFLLLLAAGFRKRLLRPTTATAAVLAGGYLALFQGYVEAYAPFAVALTGYALALAARPGRGRNTALVLFHLAGLATYTVSFLFLPVTLWALLPAGPGRRKTMVMASAVGAAALAGLFLLGPHLPAEWQRLDPSRSLHDFLEHIGLVGSRSWIPGIGRRIWQQPDDLLGGLLFSTGPASLVLLALALSVDGRPALGRVLRTPLGILAAGLLLFRFLIITPLGPFLDWDLHAALGIPLVLLAARALDQPEVRGPAERLWPTLATVAIILLVPIVALLASPDLTTSRFEAFLEGRPALVPSVAGQVQHRIGHQLAIEGRRPEAARAFEKSLALYPRHEAARRAGVNWLLAGDETRALADFDRAIAINPADTLSLLQRAGINSRRGRPAEAQQDFEAILAIAPGNTRALFSLATILARQGDADGAAALFERARPALERLASGSAAHGRDLYELGVCLRALGRNEAAATAFRRALEARPPWEPARRALEEMGR